MFDGKTLYSGRYDFSRNALKNVDSSVPMMVMVAIEFEPSKDLPW